VSAQRQKSRRAGTLVDANKPVVFISFLRSDEIEPLETGCENGRNSTSNMSKIHGLMVQGLLRFRFSLGKPIRVLRNLSSKLSMRYQVNVTSKIPDVALPFLVVA